MKTTCASMDIMDKLLAEGRHRITIDCLQCNDDLSIDMLRLDQLDEDVSGNKWFKLYYNIKQALSVGATSLLSFGGAWSNHLAALAAVAAKCGLPSMGIIRGIYPGQPLTATLEACKANGMNLHFVSRQEYDKKYDPEYLAILQLQYPGAFIIPEGGNNTPGRAGTQLITSFIPKRYTHICVSVGTGTTLAGIRQALPLHQQLIGFAPMKGGKYLVEEIAVQLSAECNTNWTLTDQYHFGGFGKVTEELKNFMQLFYNQHAISLDRIYTAKMMYGVQNMIHHAYFPTGSKILCIHTGGLQGNASL